MNREAPLNILLVDDDEFARNLSGRAFEALGQNVFEYSNPQDGIKAVEQDPKLHRLILSDFNMPVMNGFAMIQKIQEIREKERVALPMAYFIYTGNVRDLPLETKLCEAGIIVKAKPIRLPTFQEIVRFTRELIS